MHLRLKISFWEGTQLQHFAFIQSDAIQCIAWDVDFLSIRSIVRGLECAMTDAAIYVDFCAMLY
jgi:hypothetical protein